MLVKRVRFGMVMVGCFNRNARRFCSSTLYVLLSSGLRTLVSFMFVHNGAFATTQGNV